MHPENGIILVVGGTGRLGYHVVKELIEAGFQVRLVSRNFKSVEQVFGEDLCRIESVFECDIFQECRMQKSKLESEGKKQIHSVLDLAFDRSHQNLKIQGVVNVIGLNLKNKDEDAHTIEYTTNQLLIALCKKHSVSNYVLVSSCLVTRPFHPLSVFINLVSKNSLANKPSAENAVRNSGLNYIIVRPGRLEGDQTTQTKTDYMICQGDQRVGRISRATVGNIIVDAIKDNTLPKKVTFECFSNKALKKQEYRTFSSEGLKQDTEENIVRGSHKKAKATYSFFFIAGIALLASIILKKN